MDIIKRLTKLDGETYINEINTLIKKSRDVRRKIIDNNISDEVKIKILIDDVYLFNIYNQCLLLNCYRSNNKVDLENYNKSLELILNYNYEFNQDIEVLKRIIALHSKTNNPDHKFFLYKVIKSQEKYGTCNKNYDTIINLIKNIDKTEAIINDILSKPVSLQIDRHNIDAQSSSIMSSVYPDKKNTIVIDKSRYYYLLKKISSQDIRNHIEEQFMKKYNDLIPGVTKLILSRHTYAQLLESENFYKFMSNKTSEDTENLKIMLNDLNEKIDIQLKNTFDILMKKYNNNNKLSINDMIYSLDKLYPDIKFKPVDIIQTIMILLVSKFNIKFKQSNITPLNPDCNPLEIRDKNNILRGYLFLDLVKSKKSIKQLTLLKLSQGYGENLPVLYLLGNYTDLEKEICSISDVVNIFREFGNILNNIFVYTPSGIGEDDVELINFVPDLMEFFAFDKNILYNLCKNKEMVKNIINARYHSLLIDIKLKCINVLYDNLIHSSKDLINLIKKDKEFKYNIIVDLYKKVYNDIFSNLKDYVDFDIHYILPQVIHNIVNGHQGLLYGNILSLILAFNAYTSISTNNRLEKLFELLENKNYSYKKNLIKFISDIDEDYYTKFLKECLKIKNIVVDNYFDDVTATATQTEAN
jgi:hypothetical protein